MDTGYPMSKSTNPMLMLAHAKFIHKRTHIQQTPKQKQQAWFILRMGSPNFRVMGPMFGRIFKGLECVVLIFLGGKRHLFSSRQLAAVCPGKENNQIASARPGRSTTQIPKACIFVEKSTLFDPLFRC